MAESPPHKLGQIIGDVLEEAIGPVLEEFAKTHGLYLDRKGPRPSRPGNKVSWSDRNGNIHDLDFVLERGGSADHPGAPIAFIETAWRRYTKHSRNKAQEIQGAILPLAERYSDYHPFKGAVLAGCFTDGAITQLRSLGFSILHLSHDSVVRAFQQAGINVRFEESTPDEELAKELRRWESLDDAQRRAVAARLVAHNADSIQRFVDELACSVMRRVESVLVVPLHGSPTEWSTVEEAVGFISGYPGGCSGHPLVRYELHIRYSNGDCIQGRFADKAGAVDFLGRCSK